MSECGAGVSFRLRSHPHRRKYCEAARRASIGRPCDEVERLIEAAKTNRYGAETIPRSIDPR
jgi:hypothetical protein